MTEAESRARGANPTKMRMQLRYGVNETDSWWHFALGPKREQIWARLREMDTRIIRIFLFDKNAPDPVTDWHLFASYIQAVLNVGAIPMVTFAKFPRPVDDPRAVRWFANRCADVVWSCIEEWGGETVRDWYWCIWNEPNNTWISGGLSFEQYRCIYEEVAQRILRWLSPFLEGQKLQLGGPSVEGFDPFWMDWIWRFVNEIDHSLVGFVNWHLYADWREHGEKGAPRDGLVHRNLIMFQTQEYESRARAVANLLGKDEILNVCGEWNAHSNPLPHVRARFNQTLFGAAYGASALLHLMRGDADAEMLWTGTDDACGYGVLDKDARPTPLFYAKALCAQYIRVGDWISFPLAAGTIPNVDVVAARGEDGRQSALLVHLKDEMATYALSELAGDAGDYRTLLKIDGGTGNQVMETSCNGTVSFNGYGVAVVTNAVAGRDNCGQLTWS
jgi:Glycosyl hydrolases family 39